MTNVTINANRLTSTGKLDSSAKSDGNPLPILLGRMDVSMVADGADLLGSAANNARWLFDRQGGAGLTKQSDAGVPYVRGVYVDRSGGGMTWPSIYFNFPNGASPQEFYVQFYARRDGSVAAGCKFVKCYGIVGGGGDYANTTFNNGYSSSTISSVAYGDGTGTTNDNTELLYYNAGGTYQTVNRPTEGTWASGRFPSVPANQLTRSFVNGGAWTGTDWGNGTQWHKFQLRIKQNSGTTSLNETNDGLYEVWVDNVLRCAGYNIMNRNPINGRFYRIEFLSYMQDAAGFTLDVKNVTISTGGWID